MVEIVKTQEHARAPPTVLHWTACLGGSEDEQFDETVADLVVAWDNGKIAEAADVVRAESPTSDAQYLSKFLSRHLVHASASNDELEEC